MTEPDWPEHLRPHLTDSGEAKVQDPNVVAEFYDVSADVFEERIESVPHNVQRFRMMEGVIRRLGKRARSILEVGCGTGRIMRQLDPPRMVGIDIAPRMLRHARAAGFTVARADVHDLPFASDTFDLVIVANCVIRYTDYARTLSECARVMTAGGRAIVNQYSKWCRPLIPRFRPLQARHPLSLERLEDLRRPAREAGLVEEAVHLWRDFRFPPYLIRVPFEAGKFWSRVNFVFRKPA